MYSEDVLLKSLGLVSPWSPVCPRYVLYAYFSGLRGNNFFYWFSKSRRKDFQIPYLWNYQQRGPSIAWRVCFLISSFCASPQSCLQVVEWGLLVCICAEVWTALGPGLLCLQLQLPASLSKKKSCQQGVGGLPAAVLLSQAACSQPSRQ